MSEGPYVSRDHLSVEITLFRKVLGTPRKLADGLIFVGRLAKQYRTHEIGASRLGLEPQKIYWDEEYDLIHHKGKFKLVNLPLGYWTNRMMEPEMRDNYKMPVINEGNPRFDDIARDYGLDIENLRQRIKLLPSEDTNF